MSRRAVATVNLAAIERNCARLASRLTGGASLCAVVKADAYGHGAVPSARAALAGGATWLAVATADEAQTLRAEGIEGRVLVMGALEPDDLARALQADADVVAWRPAFVRALAALRPTEARVHVKLDTGMGRLGTRDVDEARETAELVAAADGLVLAGAMTHFATADEPDDGFMAAQLERFLPFADELRQLQPGIVVHAANSAATLRDPRTHLDMVRCGIAIYGIDPSNRDPSRHDLEPALELTSYVADVKTVAPGESAGYGRRFIAERATSLGVVPIGYGDGVRRGLSNNADLLVGGQRHPIVGMVSMDNLTIDAGDSAAVRPGEPAVLIGTQGAERVLAEELAQRLGTIAYEVVCGIGPRVPRVYTRDREPVTAGEHEPA
jgi:alanine racemase